MNAWLLVAALFLAGQTEIDPDRARSLYHQALDQQAELNLDSTLVLLRAARDADLSNLAIHLEYIAQHTRWTPEGHEGMRQEYAELPDGPIVHCLRAYLEAPPDYLAGAGPALLAMEERGEGNGCPTVLLPGIMRELRPFEVWDPRRLDYYPRALAIAPEVEGLWTGYAQTLASLGRFRDAERLLEEAAGSLAHPIERMPLNMRRAEIGFLRGDTSSAVALRRAVAAAVDRDGRPGLRLSYLYELDGSLGRWEFGSDEGWAGPIRQLAEFAREHHAWNFEWQARYSLGMRLSDRGEPILAVEELTRAAEVADSVGIPSLQAQSYYKKGRALGRMGRWDEAEADIGHAIEFATTSRSPYRTAEAWHTLYEVYTRAGRLGEALVAADHFLAAADPLRHSSLRWAAHFEAGEVRWKLGWHAAANQAFERAVSVIDEQREYHNYAGEYFERQGDLARAKEYYTRGTTAYGGGAESVRALSWAGLARMYLELGQVDSAEVAATAHDVGTRSERAVPLLPWVLAEEGRLDEAVEIAAGWVQERTEAGNIAGASAANLQWGELSLEAGGPATALAAARRADSLALLLDLVDESIQGKRLEGLALAALGDTVGALSTLRLASGRADNLSSAATFQATHVALGDLLSATGRTDEALAAYEQAAGKVLQTTVGFEMDLDRVRYRDRHLNPYDGGVLALIRDSGRADRIPELVRWSQRRKAEALRLGIVGTVDEGHLRGSLSVAEIQSRLRELDAVVDFQEVGDSVWALVIRRNSVALRSTPLGCDSLAAMAQALTRPFSEAYGGRLDLARAPFDEALSHGLYRALWEPFSDLLFGIRRVFLVPDGGLHMVPFAALVVENPDEKDRKGPGLAGPRYLLDDFEIIHLPSVGFLPGPEGLRAFDPVSTRILAVVGKAPGTAEEVEGIRSTWRRGGVRVLAGEDASESRMVSVAGEEEYDVLHLATHALADDRDPLASHLRLLADSESDGLLQPVEIAGVPGGFRLVVLSACETHAGRSLGGEGLMGLSRAFMAAGAEAVVASRWLVGGQASQLMEDFYRQLSRSESTTSALRSAQLSARNRAATSHPFFWAGFVLQVSGR